MHLSGSQSLRTSADWIWAATFQAFRYKPRHVCNNKTRCMRGIWFGIGIIRNRWPGTEIIMTPVRLAPVLFIFLLHRLNMQGTAALKNPERPKEDTTACSVIKQSQDKTRPGLHIIDWCIRAYVSGQRCLEFKLRAPNTGNRKWTWITGLLEK